MEGEIWILNFLLKLMKDKRYLVVSPLSLKYKILLLKSSTQKPKLLCIQNCIKYSDFIIYN